MTKKLILASVSPRRRELLRMLGLSFTPVDSGVDESGLSVSPLPSRAVRELATVKARAVSGRFSGDIVVAADTIVVVGKEILGKPANEEEARDMLRRLSGRWHQVFTGMTVTDGQREVTDHEETWVRFYPLTESDIDGYVGTGEPMDKAGAYGIQGFGSLLVKEIRGCYFNVVGLPVARLARHLADFGIEIFGGRR